MKTKKSLKKFGIFAALPLSIFFIVLAVPFGQGLFLTFTDWDGFSYEKFIGVGNYAKSFQDPEFWTTLTFTLKFVLVSLVAVNVVAFGLALLVTAKLKSKKITCGRTGIRKPTRTSKRG
jgi:raffinose/stachyose/melibiose transport system permease protein